MKAWIVEQTGTITGDSEPIRRKELPDPAPGKGEIRISVSVCGICHTELDEIEGRAAPPKLPVIPGHQIVGRVDAVGTGVTLHKPGDRVGVGWIFDACGQCKQCLSGRENPVSSFELPVWMCTEVTLIIS